MQNSCFRAMFRTIVGAPFLGVGFPAVQSAFWAPITCGECYFRTSWRSSTVAACRFWRVLAAVPCVLRQKFSLSLRFWRGRTRKCRSTWQGLTSLATNPPGNCKNKRFLAWGGVRAREKGDSKREKPDPERTFSQIFADFR